MLVYLNGTLTPAEKALIPVTDRGFRFGDGVFENIAVHNGQPYQWGFHAQRLASGLKALKISYVPAPLEDAVRELIAANQFTSGYVRIAISRGSGSAGFLPLPGCIPTVVIETVPAWNSGNDPVALWLSTREKISPRALPLMCKTAQGLSSTLARMEASEQGCFDALLLTPGGIIAETSTANLFWCKDDVLYTPALSTGALPGSTRHAIMRLAPGVREMEAALSVLEDADAVILTSTGAGVRAVASLAPCGWSWNSEAAATTLRDLMHKDIAAACGVNVSLA